jgi:ParB-like chromosome segregation protein Spo0J
MKAHPVADLFPMLADDELRELADDIKTRGLLQPIVVEVVTDDPEKPWATTHERILDGRNRLAACEIAGIEPRFTTYEGSDPDGYALAVNIARRHLNKGQIAMVAARALLLSNNDDASQDRAARAVGVSQPRVSQASTVLTHAPDLADAVVFGVTSLNEAYEVARKSKEDAESSGARLARLRTDAPDLADQVTDENNPMTLAQAEAAHRTRTQELLEKRQRWSRNLGGSLMLVWSCLDPDPVDAVERNWIPEQNPHRDMPSARDLYTPKGLRAVADLCTVLADHLEDAGSDLL